MTLDRDTALAFFKTHNPEETLLKHALSVEASMRHFARKYGEDDHYWGIVGLLHDIDFGKHPTEHLKHSRAMLTEAGYDEAFIHAVDSHGWGLCSDVKPEHKMEKVLFTIDELSGFVTACALVRPSKSVMDMEVRSVKKKWKEKNFAQGVDRSVIEKGAEMMGEPLDSLIEETILALRPIANDIGVYGTPGASA